MSKKKKQRNTTIFCSIEGIVAEAELLKHLISNYTDTTKSNFPENPKKGGNPDIIISFALKACHYDRCFAWIDEDVDISEDTRKNLAKAWCVEFDQDFLSCPLKDLQSTYNSAKNRKPVLIVSQPVCVESMVIILLGHELPIEEYDQKERRKQITTMKNSVKGILQGKSFSDHCEQCLTKELIEERRKLCPELDLLIKMITVM